MQCLEPDELKFFVSNGPRAIPCVEILLLVAFLALAGVPFQKEHKSEIGRDPF